MLTGHCSVKTSHYSHTKGFRQHRLVPIGESESTPLTTKKSSQRHFGAKAQQRPYIKKTSAVMIKYSNLNLKNYVGQVNGLNSNNIQFLLDINLVVLQLFGSANQR